MRFSFIFLFYRVLKLQNGEVQFYRCFCVGCLQVIIQEFSDNLSTFLHQSLLLGFILDVGKGLDIAIQFSHFGKGFNYRQGSLNSLWAFEDGGQHIQALFGKGFRINRRMLQPIEPVEIFHQFIFFRF